MKDHKLELVQFYGSPNTGGEIRPELIVIHYTASRTLMSSARWLASPKSKASVHVLIGRDGKVMQMVPFNIKAWHCGESEYKGRPSVNNFSIGIELCNWGKLDYRHGEYRTNTGTAIHDTDVVSMSHKLTPDKIDHWEAYTQNQWLSCLCVCEELCEVYNIQDIVGHDDVARPLGRKIDPGPAFDLARLRSKLGFSDESRYAVDQSMNEIMLIRKDLQNALKRIDRLLDRRDD